MSLAWCLTNERVSTVLMGASKPEQITDNVGAIQCYHKLKENTVIMDEIEEIIQTKPVPLDKNKQVLTHKWITNFRYGGMLPDVDVKLWA